MLDKLTGMPSFALRLTEAALLALCLGGAARVASRRIGAHHLKHWHQTRLGLASSRARRGRDYVVAVWMGFALSR